MRSGDRRGRQHGFTYLAALILVALTAGGLAAYGEVTSHARQREKEAELVWIGNQFREAIGLYYQRTPGAVKRFPQELEDLVQDGKPDWGLVRAPGGGIAGVYSLGGGRSIGRAGHGGMEVSGGASYQEWKFRYEPPASHGSNGR
jgi:uncharacterized protein GlcG (DUF336 family)